MEVRSVALQKAKRPKPTELAGLKAGRALSKGVVIKIMVPSLGVHITGEKAIDVDIDTDSYYYEPWSKVLIIGLYVGSMESGAHVQGAGGLHASYGWLSKLWSFWGPLNTKCRIGFQKVYIRSLDQ